MELEKIIQVKNTKKAIHINSRFIVGLKDKMSDDENFPVQCHPIIKSERKKQKRTKK